VVKDGITILAGRRVQELSVILTSPRARRGFITSISQPADPHSRSDLGEVGAFLTAWRGRRTLLFTRMDSSVDHLMLVENFRQPALATCQRPRKNHE